MLAVGGVAKSAIAGGVAATGVVIAAAAALVAESGGTMAFIKDMTTILTPIFLALIAVIGTVMSNRTKTVAANTTTLIESQRDLHAEVKEVHGLANNLSQQKTDQIVKLESTAAVRANEPGVNEKLLEVAKIQSAQAIQIAEMLTILRLQGVTAPAPALALPAAPAPVALPVITPSGQVAQPVVVVGQTEALPVKITDEKKHDA